MIAKPRYFPSYNNYDWQRADSIEEELVFLNLAIKALEVVFKTYRCCDDILSH